MLLRHRGHEPVVAPTATLVGDVRVGPRARVMYGAVLDAEGARVEVGECAIVCEHAVLRATAAGGTSRPVVSATTSSSGHTPPSSAVASTAARTSPPARPYCTPHTSAPVARSRSAPWFTAAR